MREVAIVGVGPDDSWEDRDETVTEDVGLPEHERDESRRRPGESFEDDPAEVAKDGFEALMAGKDHVIAGSVKNKGQVAAGKLLPEKARAGLHAVQTRPDQDD